LTKKTTDSQVADNDIIAVGSTNGVINLYNIAKGDIQGQLVSEPAIVWLLATFNARAHQNVLIEHGTEED